MLCPNTSSKSLLHRLAHGLGPDDQPPGRAILYLLVLVVFYVPLLVAASLGTVPLWHQTDLVKLTLLRDFGLNYALLVSLPTLVVLLATDHHLLCTALEEVQQDEVFALSESSARSLKQRWNHYFRRFNLIGQVAAIGFGITLGIVTVRIYVKQNVTSWIASDSHLHLAGYVYVYCISALYAMVMFYVARTIIISLFLRALVAVAPLRILLLHPDKCGGLRPVGRLGLRNQYTLTVLGLNLVLLLLMWVYEKPMTSFGEIMVAGSAAYLILGPVIFMAPLLPFRAAMQNAKRDRIHEFARELRVETERIRKQLKTDAFSEEDSKSIERLRKWGAAIDELPIWPFDPGTLRKFGTAYVVPVVIPLLGQAVKLLLKLIG